MVSSPLSLREGPGSILPLSIAFLFLSFLFLSLENLQTRGGIAWDLPQAERGLRKTIHNALAWDGAGCWKVSNTGRNAFLGPKNTVRPVFETFPRKRVMLATGKFQTRGETPRV